MALPLIPILIGVAAAGTGGWGIFKGAKAVSDNNEANDVNDRARRLYDDIQDRLKKAREKSKKALEALGNKKIHVCEVPVGRFVTLFEKVKNIELSGSEGLDELANLKQGKESLVSGFKELNLMAISFAQGTLGGAVAGGAVAFGAYSAAGAFAAASTGTAIAGLSGAAATNATLAFFGGGALAAGGLGMAGGMAVLGGVVAGPALAIMGAVMGAKASANLDNAYSNLAKVKEAEAEIGLMVTACNGITRRADLFTQVLIRLEALIFPQLDTFENIIASEGCDFKKYKDASKKHVAALLATAQAVKAILDTALLDETGALTKESEDVLLSSNKYLKNATGTSL